MNFYSFCAFFSLVFAGFSFGMQMQQTTQGMQVKVFNVGQGNCAVVTYPGQPSLLIDAGSDQHPNQPSDTVIISNIARYLYQNSTYGVSVLISHPDKDHVCWMQRIIDLIPGSIKDITVGGFKESYINPKIGKPKKTASEIVPNKVPRVAKSLISPAWAPHIADSRIPNYSHLPFYCTLWHTGANQQEPNDQSLIVCVEDANFRVILPGDAGIATFNAGTIVPSTKLTYLIASHHGSDSEGANDPSVLQLLAPTRVIISSGMHARYYHPTASTISTLTLITQPSVIEHFINCQTPANLIGSDSTAAVINYTNKNNENKSHKDKFSVCRTTHPIHTTNNEGDITISVYGVNVSEPRADIISTLNRRYFDNYNFDTIRHLFLAGMNINDAQLQQLQRLPIALTYFNLENNKISASGLARIINFLQFHGNRLAIKTSGNMPTEVHDLKPLLIGNSNLQTRPTISLCWNTIMGYRFTPQEPPCQLRNIICTPPTIVASEPTGHNTLSFEELQKVLITARANNAQTYSTQLSANEPEIFIHYPDRTEWHSHVYNFVPSLMYHPGASIRATWRKNNDFFLSDGINTYIFEQQRAQQLEYKNWVPGSPSIAQPRLDVTSGIYHIASWPGNGMGEQELTNLNTFRFGLAQPISMDGNTLLTIGNGSSLLIHKKINDNFMTIKTSSFPNIKSASFCDADQSISIEYQDGRKELLPLIMETI